MKYVYKETNFLKMDVSKKLSTLTLKQLKQARKLRCQTHTSLTIEQLRISDWKSLENVFKILRSTYT